MFLQRRASLFDSPALLTASRVRWDMSTVMTRKLARVPSSSGLSSQPALWRFFSVKAPVSAMISPPPRTSARLTLSAAGFMATRTSTMSPAVLMPVAPKLI